MSNVYFQLYLEETLALVRTLVIKCEAIADTINEQLGFMGYEINYDDPTTWKYYKNLAGEYHVSDTPIIIRSVDTLEEIEFNVANLQIHRATAREYFIGTDYYTQLCAMYPDQVTLINGILAPVDKDKAINAQDGEILYFSPARVLGNEDYLIKEIQNWVYGFFNKWYNRQYVITDDLYLAAFWGILMQQLPVAIQLLRLKAAKTPHAHSFHIREYLASHGRLDAFIPYLTREQQLYLYRNIRYLQRNVGKQEIFDELVDKLLTKRGLPLSAYTLDHDITSLPDRVRPEIEAVKHPVNLPHLQEGDDRIDVHTILSRENTIARDNVLVQFDTEQDINSRFGSGAFSRLPTKVLESEVVDRTSASVRTLGDVLLQHWLFLSTHDRYLAFVNVPNPRDGELMNMSVRDAFIINLYAFSKAWNLELETIPRVYAYDVLRPIFPTFDDLYWAVAHDYVSEDLVRELMAYMTPLGEYISTEDFYEACNKLHQEYIALWRRYSVEEHYKVRGWAEQVARTHFQHIKCTLLDEDIGIEQWLNENGYEIIGLAPDQYKQLHIDAISAATGSNLVSHTTLAEIQKAMLNLMSRLSSYSVHYLRDITASDFHYLAQPDIRVGDVWADSSTRHTVPVPYFKAHFVHSHNTKIYNLNDTNFFQHIEVGIKSNLRHVIDTDIDITLKEEDLADVRLHVFDVGVLSCTIEHIDNIDPDDNDLEQYNP